LRFGDIGCFQCESQIITVWQGIADSLDEAVRLDAIIIDFSKAFDLVCHGRLLKKIAASVVDSRVVVWKREFLIGRSQRVRVGGVNTQRKLRLRQVHLKGVF
jgi:hypothetical protein